jgi:hypothetical protein
VALRDPVAAYNAATNTEAQVLRDTLVGAGIEAYVTEDLSVVGTWLGGFIPEIHKPQVWIDRADVDRVRPLLQEYERRQAERRSAPLSDDERIETTCEQCGRPARFAATQRDSVQECPHCGAYIDVAPDDAWDEAEAGNQED